MIEERKRTGPVLIELDAEAEPAAPEEAPPVPDAGPLAEAAAMPRIVTAAARPPSRLARWFWGALSAILVFFVSLAAWNTLAALLASSHAGTSASVSARNKPRVVEARSTAVA